MATDVLLFNPRSPEFHADPYPTYARLRAEDPMHRSPSGFFLFTRYADCHAALRDNRFGREGLEGFEQVFRSAYGGGDQGARVPRAMLFSNPPDHTRLRSLVNKAFTSRVIEAMRGNVQAIVDDLLERRWRTGAMDLIEDLAYPLPVAVICQMLGLPLDDERKIRTWSGDIVRCLDTFGQSADLVMRGDEARRHFVDYFRAAIADRRREPRDDLLSLLIAAEEAGDKLTTGELLATCVLLFVAGHETTVNLIGNGLLALLQHPDEFARLRAEPELLGSAIEEMLRYDAPIQRAPRVLVEDVTIDGCTFRKGAIVILALGGANRDPAQFPDPNRFDIGRRDNRHLSFGFGIHFCIGAALARLEAQIAIGTLLERIPPFALATERPQWRETSTLRGLKSLPVTW